MQSAIDAAQPSDATPRVKAPALPPLNFFLHSVAPDNSIKNTVFQFNLKIPKRALYDILYNVVESHVSTDPNKKSIVRIGIVGGDNILHNFITSYVPLKIGNPTLFQNLEVQLFLVPTEMTELGLFLSKYDGWFARHVHLGIPALSKVIPQLIAPSGAGLGNSNNAPSSPMMDQLKNSIGSRANSSDKLKVEEEEKNCPTPSVLLRHQLESYFRDAKSKLEVPNPFLILNLRRCFYTNVNAGEILILLFHFARELKSA